MPKSSYFERLSYLIRLGSKVSSHYVKLNLVHINLRLQLPIVKPPTIFKYSSSILATSCYILDQLLLLLGEPQFRSFRGKSTKLFIFLGAHCSSAEFSYFLFLERPISGLYYNYKSSS